MSVDGLAKPVIKASADIILTHIIEMYLQYIMEKNAWIFNSHP